MRRRSGVVDRRDDVVGDAPLAFGAVGRCRNQGARPRARATQSMARVLLCNCCTLANSVDTIPHRQPQHKRPLRTATKFTPAAHRACDAALARGLPPLTFIGLLSERRFHRETE
jgi:hypothetical protein